MKYIGDHRRPPRGFKTDLSIDLDLVNENFAKAVNSIIIEEAIVAVNPEAIILLKGGHPVL